MSTQHFKCYASSHEIYYKQNKIRQKSAKRTCIVLIFYVVSITIGYQISHSYIFRSGNPDNRICVIHSYKNILSGVTGHES